MSKIIFLFVLAFVSLTTLAKQPPKVLNGTFGVYNTQHIQFQLTLKADQSFEYAYINGKGKPEIATGTWENAGRKVILKSSNASKYNTIWKVKNNGNTLSSRKGFTFLRLCKLAA